MQLRPDITEAAARLTPGFDVSRELHQLGSHLRESEMVFRLAAGVYGSGGGLLAVTNRRVLLLRDGRSGQASEGFPLERLTSVEWIGGPARGAILVQDAHNTAELSQVEPREGTEIVALIRSLLPEPLAEEPDQDEAADEDSLLGEGSLALAGAAGGMAGAVGGMAGAMGAAAGNAGAARSLNGTAGTATRGGRYAVQMKLRPNRETSSSSGRVPEQKSAVERSIPGMPVPTYSERMADQELGYGAPAEPTPDRAQSSTPGMRGVERSGAVGNALSGEVPVSRLAEETGGVRVTPPNGDRGGEQPRSRMRPEYAEEVGLLGNRPESFRGEPRQGEFRGEPRPDEFRPDDMGGGARQDRFRGDSGPGYRESGPRDYRESGPGNYRETGPGNYRESGPRDYRETGPRDYRESGPRDYRETGSGGYRAESRSGGFDTDPRMDGTVPGRRAERTGGGSRRKKWILIGGVAAGAVGLAAVGGVIVGNKGASSVNPAPAADSGGGTVKVSKVVDGDTIEVEGSTSGPVEILGITAPRADKSQCGAADATGFATRTLGGSQVTLVTDPSQPATDKAGRRLASVRTANGLDYSVLAAQAGMARYYESSPAVAQASEIKAGQTEAQKAERGMWGPPCNAKPSSSSSSGAKAASTSESGTSSSRSSSPSGRSSGSGSANDEGALRDSDRLTTDGFPRSGSNG